MSDIGNQAAKADLAREWLAARMVFVAGFAIAIAFAVIWSVTHKQEFAGGLGDETVSDSSSAAPTSEGLMACRASIVIAQNFGVVPNKLKFTGGPSKTDTVGRYICLANDGAGIQYAVAFDLICRNLNDARCVSVYRATKPDGTVLYQRNITAAESQQGPSAPDASSVNESTGTASPAPPDRSDTAPTSNSGDGSSASDASPQQQQP